MLGTKVFPWVVDGKSACTHIFLDSLSRFFIRFALKLPHPTAVLEVHVLAEDVDGEIVTRPYGTALVPLGELKVWFVILEMRVWGRSQGVVGALLLCA